jgi:hypothetical protein
VPVGVDRHQSSPRHLPAQRKSARLLKRLSLLGGAIVQHAVVERTASTTGSMPGAGSVEFGSSSDPARDLLRSAEASVRGVRYRQHVGVARVQRTHGVSRMSETEQHGAATTPHQNHQDPASSVFLFAGSSTAAPDADSADSASRPPRLLNAHKSDEHSRATRLLVNKAREVAVKALAASLKIIAAVRRSRDVAKCAELLQLRTRLPGYAPDAVAGLHFTRWVGKQLALSRILRGFLPRCLALILSPPSRTHTTTHTRAQWARIRLWISSQGGPCRYHWSSLADSAFGGYGPSVRRIRPVVRRYATYATAARSSSLQNCRLYTSSATTSTSRQL